MPLPYELRESCPTAYTEFRGRLSLRAGASRREVAASRLWFATWTTPMDLEIGGLYLRPDQRQFVRLNLGFTTATLATLTQLRLELVRRGTGKVLKQWTIDDVPRAVVDQRKKIPVELREDFRNLLLTDLDISFLPLQPFADPQRNWFLRARVLDGAGGEVARMDSSSFCRQAHDPVVQLAIREVAIKDGMVRVNGQPWMPWGAIYGFIPVFAGPEKAGPVAFRDLHNLPDWGLYDRFTAAPYTRSQNDFDCARYVAASITNPAVLEKRWREDNVYASTVFATPTPAFSADDLVKLAGGETKLEAYLKFCRTSPMVVSVTPGMEEAFGLFQKATTEQLHGLGQVVERLRRETGKPVMVGHGGYWNRFEFEKVPYFDIYDPETEPLFPANVHTDLTPLIAGRDKVAWLRPQMYEDVPYERWRFHVYVELMRGCRGWQIAHGPGDSSLFRGLRGELEYLKPAIAAADHGSVVTFDPPIEHWSREHDGKLTVIAATTRGIPFVCVGSSPGRADRPVKRSGRPAMRGKGRVTLTASNICPTHAPGPRGRRSFSGFGWTRRLRPRIS